MRATAIGFAMTALIAGKAFAAEVEQTRVFSLQHAETARQFQSLAKTLGAMASIRIATNGATKSLTAEGSSEEIELADWLVKHLDRQMNAPSTDAGVVAYKGLAGWDDHGERTHDDVVRISYLTAETELDFYELAGAVRTTSNIQHMVTDYEDGKLVAMRGSPDRIAMAEWMLAELIEPAGTSVASPSHDPSSHDSSSRDYWAGSNDLMRVFHLAHGESVHEFREIAEGVEKTVGASRAFVDDVPRALAVRGTPDQIAMAEWLLNEVDRRAESPEAVGEYRAAGAADDVVRVYPLSRTVTSEELQEISTGAGIRYGFVANGRLVMRGTTGQLAAAEEMVRSGEGYK